MTRVLQIDDDVELGEMLCEYLEQEGFEAKAVHDAEKGVREALTGEYAAVVLDVMLPDFSGVEALRRIRKRSRVPVLMLTAKGDPIDRVIGLELGADDYVPKPCTPRELVARLRAILRRVEEGDAMRVEGPISAGKLTLWPARRRAEWDGRAVDLTSTEFNLLTLLARDAGRLVSKADLSKQGLGRPLAPFDRSIDVHIASLRRKIGTLDNGPSCIRTVRGQGYLLVEE